MTATLRDPSSPLPLPASWPRRRTEAQLCGYVLDPMTLRRCPARAAYAFVVTGWEPGRWGAACPEHAAIARSWDLAWIRSWTGKPGDTP